MADDERSEAADVSLSRETFGGAIAQFAMAAVGFAGTIIFARWLGPSAFGGVYLLLAVVKLADRPMNGWSLAAKKRLSESDALRSPAFGAQLLFDLGWVGVAGVAALLAGDALADYTGLAAAPLLAVLLLASESTYETVESLVQGRGRISVATWIDALRSVLTLPLQIALVSLVGAAGMVYGLAAASLLALPVVSYFVAARPELPSRAFLGSLADYARYSVPSSALGTAYDRLDLLLLGYLLVPAAAGFYEVAWMLTMPAVFVADVAGRGLMAKVSGRAANGEGVGQDVSNTVAYAGLLAFPMLAGAVALARPLVVTVYGPAYRNAATLLVGLALYRILRTQTGPLLQAINGLDRPDVAMGLSAVALAVNVVLGVVLTLRFGAIGVVAATVVAEALRYAGAVAFLWSSVTAFAPVSRPMAAQVGASLVTFAVASAARGALPVRSWVDLGVLVGTGAAAYGVALVALSPGFRHTLGVAVRESLADVRH
ncbi:oligosaccharide flippase family protein [Halomicrococcus sp. SG-WS-1]|uniref:oligosaccharide flippase family protein n=1 Tax=Halomicrococcus sp. SG-WS-1 TaxID=3439057 RepID=UPI003F79917A